MIIEEIRDIKPTIRELRRFSIEFGLVLSLWAGILLWRKQDYYVYFFISSWISFFLGLFLPVLLKPIYIISTALLKLLACVITNLILIILFYALITPIGLVLRLFGENLLELQFDKKKDSYWIPRKTVKFVKENYERGY